MDRLRIRGGGRLAGVVRVGGAKNAALPAMAASILTAAPLRLRNLPEVADVHTMQHLLEHIGASCTLNGSACEIAFEDCRSTEAPYEMVKKMRASVLVLGPLLARFRRARVSLPGGCAIGDRPINLHLEGLARMGAQIEIEHGYVNACCDALRGASIFFETVTVTGTENLLMAAALAEGRTELHNCAREPEVVDLAVLLRKMGADIDGEGTETIVVRGVRELKAAEHDVIPDRIEAGTYIAAAAITGGDVTIERCRPDHLDAVTALLEATGAGIERGQTSIRVKGGGPLLSHDIHTAPYPHFPTDMQAQFMALMTQATGLSIITEEIFNNRFMHVQEFCRMGADIHVAERRAVVRGPTKLSGASVMATDLRASAGLILAAIVADGETTIDRVYHLDRGYEHMEQKLSALGAHIERIK
ncbi:MAG: UDP-N-acetylglucosamine 1-carboxyvinyltransferase [Acidobacteria bacterium]|nr:UDP-N-acetylglucosamine 1-carboxyvinyltransferase [Acidobacteriota bacterium]